MLDKQAFEHVVHVFADTLVPKEDGATIIALSGDLGSGKTTFVQTLARYWGVAQTVTSPTFVIMKSYTLSRGPFRRLVHIDAYRLKSARELEVLGWKDIGTKPDTLICIEWPERVSSVIPADARAMLLTFIDEEHRSIEGIE